MVDSDFHSRYADWKKRAESLDQKLRPIVNREVDINAPAWKELLADMPHPADESGLRGEIAALFREIVDQFRSLDSGQRQTIIDLMAKNQSLMYSAVIDSAIETRDGFYETMILFVIADQGKDTRDAIVALSHYRACGEERGFDVNLIFEHMARLASDRDKYGWGSTRDLLLRG